MSKILLTIVVPVFNCENTITRTFNSINEQLSNETELIFINDGSSDNSKTVLNQIIKNKQNIYLITQINKGLVQARKTGVDKAKGEYILFVDGGDELTNNAIEIILYNIKMFPADYYVINHKTITNGKSILSSEDCRYINDVKYLFVGKCPYSICFKVFKKEFYSNLNLYKWKTKITNAEDLCHSVELMKKTSSGRLIDEYIYVYNKENNSMSNSINKYLETLSALDFVYSQIKNDNDLIKEFCYLVYSKTLVPILLENNFDMNKELYEYYRKYNVRKNQYIRYKKLSEILAYICTKSKITNSITSIIIKKIYG